MMLDAQAGRFDVVVTEGIDRLGRNLADVARCFDQLAFRQVQLHTTGQGLVTQMHVGVMGVMAQMQLSDLAEKTRRGQLGRAARRRANAGSTRNRRKLSDEFFGIMPPARPRARSRPT
jgi:site-specific DNA recombinase